MDRSAPFVIFGLPRSRTFWVSRFLTYRDWVCGHDEARHVRAIEDVRSWMAQRNVGTVETAASPFWRLLAAGIRVAVIRRSVDEVVASTDATGVAIDRDAYVARLRLRSMKLDQIEKRVPGALSVRFSDLAREDACAALFEHCLPYRHDSEWWRDMDAANLQINLPAMMGYACAYAPQLRRAAFICGSEIRSKLGRERKLAELDGMTFQEETLDVVLRDGKVLFREHCVVVGEDPESHLTKNIELLHRLEGFKSLHVMTARCNGRMFGYLASILGPSLESATTKVATQTTFYASKDVPGLGLRLQRAAIAAIEARGGVWDVVQRAGVRGSGSRIGSMYRRMGAVEHGQLYRLRLGSGH